MIYLLYIGFFFILMLKETLFSRHIHSSVTPLQAYAWFIFFYFVFCFKLHDLPAGSTVSLTPHEFSGSISCPSGGAGLTIPFLVMATAFLYQMERIHDFDLSFHNRSCCSYLCWNHWGWVSLCLVLLHVLEFCGAVFPRPAQSRETPDHEDVENT